MKACAAKYERIWGERWEDSGDAGVNAAWFDEHLALYNEGIRIAKELVALVDKVNDYRRRTRWHYVLDDAIQSAEVHIDELVALVDEAPLESGRSLAIWCFDHFGVSESVPRDKRRKTKFEMRERSKSVRRLTDSEIAIKLLLCGFFPTLRMHTGSEYVVSEVLRAETKSVGQFRKRARKRRQPPR